MHMTFENRLHHIGKYWTWRHFENVQLFFVCPYDCFRQRHFAEGIKIPENHLPASKKWS